MSFAQHQRPDRNDRFSRNGTPRSALPLIARGDLAPEAERPAPALEVSESYRRSALAVAEAILPGSDRIPFADEGTLARVEEVVAAFDPRAVRAWRAAVVALDHAAIAWKGRPLHALSRGDQDLVLRAWEADPLLSVPYSAVAAVLKLVHFDRPSVYARMGGRGPLPALVEPVRWASRICRAAEWDGDEPIECDVVVIGTGAGGAVVGAELAARGHAVVFVEEGEHFRRDAFDGSSVRAHQRFYRAAFSLGNVAMPVFAGRLVGGSTAINGGTCYRTPPWVLDRWCEELKTDELSPAAMLPYFQRVESRLGIEPAPLDRVGPIATLMARGCDALGWSHGPVLRNVQGCSGEGFCDFGCRSAARRSTDVSYVPEALERGGMLLTGLSARRILIENGRAVGVEGEAPGGRTLRVRGRRVVLSGGAIPTPLLLLRQGICNFSDQVGKNLALQPSSGFAAMFDDELSGHRYIPQGYQCDEFLRNGQLLMTAQVDVNYAALLLQLGGQRLMDVLDRHEHVASFALLIADSAPSGRVRGTVTGYPAIHYDVAEADTRRMHALMIHAGQMCLAAGATKLLPGVRSQPVLDDTSAFRTFRDADLSPRDIAWLSYHPLGTCKMGRDPRTSVVDIDHQAHDLPGLFVVDGSTVPGVLGVNPQLTIMAMATRAARGIAETL
jgi:choline dehydrogenase-like flavoprotein